MVSSPKNKSPSTSCARSLLESNIWRLFAESTRTLLKENPGAPPSARERSATREALGRLPATGSVNSEPLDTAPLERTLAEAIDKLASAADDSQRRTVFVDALSVARNLASRIGDDSNLTLDPDLDSYYVQDMVVTKMPTLLSQIGELQSQLEMPSSAHSTPENLAVRTLILDGMTRSTIEGIERDLQASYRGGSGARLRRVLDADLATMVSAWNAYLDKAKAKLGGVGETSALDHSYATAVDSAINAWAVSLAELKGTPQHETIQPSQQTAPQSPTERSSGGIEPRICADNGAAYRATTPEARTSR